MNNGTEREREIWLCEGDTSLNLSKVMVVLLYGTPMTD